MGVKQAEHPAQALPRDLPIQAVLGIIDPEDGDWARVRGLQFANLVRSTTARLVSHAVAALSVVLLFAGTVHWVHLVLWLALLAWTIGHSVRFERTLADADHRRISRDEITRQTKSAMLVAIVWMVPIGLFGIYGTDMMRLELWAIMSVLIIVTAIVLPAVPLSTLMFSGIIGVAMAMNFLLKGEPGMAALTVAFSAVVTIGAIQAARNFLIARVAEAGMAEKAEVVSLLLREFEEGGADWLWQVDTSRRVRAASPRFAFALGMNPDAIDGQPFVQLIAGNAWETGQFHASLHDLVERLTRRESFSNLLVHVTIRGAQRWWELSGTPKLDDNGFFIGFRGVGSDVTEQRESSDKIAHMARYDTLTGLPNRMMLTEALGEALRYSEQWRTRCVFMMIDLDRFKEVNDTLGHLVGDQLLARVSERLREQMSENELCGRLGGDEFAIVVRDASDLERVNFVARRVIEQLSQPYEVDNHTLYVGASIGSAIGPREGATVETLMRNADLALYRAKDEGGGTHCTYEPALHAHAEERRRLEFSLRRALERNEFALHYQPVVDSGSEAIVSFEALLRWNSGEYGSVSPVKFIPVAEDTRLIVPIGEWVLREACCEAVKWPSHIKVAVNVSGEQLLDPNFAASVINALSVSGLSPHRLEIEVTESTFVRDATNSRASLEQIMSLGCGVALDDFGTGYSSLGYLRRMRFSTIKVDRSFVQGTATGNPESLAIIRAVVAMADSLQMSTTAEGVESEEELAVVRKLGCKKIQGYYFGRPMPALEAEALFQKRAHNRTASA